MRKQNGSAIRMTPSRHKKLFKALVAAQLVGMSGFAFAVECNSFGGSGSAGTNLPPECVAPVFTNPRSIYDSGARVPESQRRNDSVISVNRAGPGIVPPKPCPSTTLFWNAGGLQCSGTAVGANDGGIVPVSDTTDPNFGNATFVCADGVYVERAGSTCNPPPPPPANCNAGQTVSWSPSGVTCTGQTSFTTHGTNSTVSDNTAPNTGSATYTCNNGTFLYQFGSCNPPPPPPPCGTATMNWSVGGVTCSATVAGVADGQTSTGFDNSEPNTGSAQFTCFNSTYLQTSAQQAANTCNAPATPPPAPCAATTKTWIFNSIQCTAPIAGNAHGVQVVASDAVGPATGSARYECSNGTYLEVPGTANCSTTAPPTVSCPSINVSWTANGLSCDGTAPFASSGNSVSVTDSTAPTTGSATFQCSNGAFSVVSGTQSCSTQTTTPPPAPCSSAPVSWSVGGNTCTAQAPATAHGGTYQVSDTTAPTTGSSSFQCLNGTHTPLSGTQSCNAPAPNTAPTGSCPIPSGFFVQWGPGNACEYTFPSAYTIPNNTEYSVQDSTAPSTGTLTVLCTNGSPAGVPSKTTCNTPTTAASSCPATSLTWPATSGSTSCSSSAPQALSGSAVSLSSTNGTPGNASFACDNGGFSLQPGSTCGQSGPRKVFGPSPGTIGYVNFKSGTDDFFFLHSLEIYSNGPTADPTIRFVSGHVREGTFGAGAPNRQVDMATVPVDRVKTFTLPSSVNSVIDMGDSLIESDPNFGMTRAYLAGGGCTGTSCSYTFYFHAEPPGQTRINFGGLGPLSNTTMGGIFPYPFTPNTYVYFDVNSFTQGIGGVCPSGQFNRFEPNGSEAGGPTLRANSAVVIPNITVPYPTVYCYADSPEPIAGYDESGRAICSDPSSTTDGFACFRRTGQVTPGVAPGRARTISFTR